MFFVKSVKVCLGYSENECCYPVRQNLMDLKSGIKKIERTNQGNKYFIGEKLKNNVFQYFIYSLIWRQVLDHRLNEGYPIIDEIYFENLRTELLGLKGLKQKEVRKIELGFNQFDFTILTTYNLGDTTTNSYH